MNLLEISQNIRKLRQKQNLTVEQLAKKSGFSKGFISQVENFRISPSLKALSAITEALGVPMAEILTNDPCRPEFSIGSVNSGEKIFRDNSERFGIHYRALAYEQFGRELEPFIIEYVPCDEVRPLMRHDTEEFFVLLDGQVDFFIGSNENAEKLSTGQTIYLCANVPHRVQLSSGCDFARALTIYSKK